MFDYMKFGAGIKFYRQQAHITIEKLAENVDITPTHLRRIEKGEARPKVDLAVKLCNDLGISIVDCLDHRFDSEHLYYKQFKSEASFLSENDKPFILNLIHQISKLEGVDRCGRR